MLAREVDDARQLREMLLSDGLAIPAALDDFIAQPRLNIQPFISTLETMGQDYAHQAALLDEQLRALREEAAQLDREIQQLRTGDREASYEAAAPQAVKLQRLLRAELGLADDEILFLCTLLQVPDEAWQDAVEGGLGRNRFTLLVPPAHYAAAMKLYRERRQTLDLYGVALLDTERVMQHPRSSFTRLAGR